MSSAYLHVAHVNGIGKTGLSYLNRRLDEHLVRSETEPGIALAGLDSMPVRCLLGDRHVYDQLVPDLCGVARAIPCPCCGAKIRVSASVVLFTNGESGFKTAHQRYNVLAAPRPAASAESKRASIPSRTEALRT
jgi:hypothetical protein